MPCCSLEGARSWRRTYGAAVELGDGRASAVPGLLLSRRGRWAGSAHTGLLSCCSHAAVAAAGCLLVQPRSWARRGLAADPSLLLGVASKGRRPLLRVCTSLAAGWICRRRGENGGAAVDLVVGDCCAWMWGCGSMKGEMRL